MVEIGSPCTFGEWLKLRRKELDLTQTELALRAGCSVPALRKIEGGVRRPSKQLAGLLAKSLEIPADTHPLFIKVSRGELDVERLCSPLPVSSGDLSLPQIASPSRVQLPFQSTAIIGRENELAAVRKVLSDPHCRLLTLIGPGGIGKTRLAVQIASEQASEFRHGVYFVPLSPLSSPDFLIPAIAQALHFEFSKGQDSTLIKRQLREQLLDYLREKQLLLILDNFEHLIPGVELLSYILAAAPQVKILATSYERLNLAEEWVYELHGLSYPQNGAGNLEDYAAVQLFLQFARRSHSDFMLDDTNRSCIRRIIQIVQGMPLGIELAAAWVRALACEDLLQEIEKSLDILMTNLHGVPERHRSMRAVFEHSWSLLSEAEQDVFRQLSIFQGGFQREAAIQVAGTTLELLTTLVDKSMLRVDPAGRYDLHEVLKQYASEKLDQVPELRDVARSRHSAYYLKLSLHLSSLCHGPDQKMALTQMNVEIENLRSAWRWAVQEEDLDKVYQAVPALVLYYWMRTPSAQEADHLNRILDSLKSLHKKYPGDPRLSGVVSLFLVTISILYRDMERDEESRLALKEGLALAIELPVDQVVSLTLALANFGVDFYDKVQVEELYTQSLEAARIQGDRWKEALIILQRSEALLMEGNYQRSYELQLQAIEIMRSLGDRWGTANGYRNLAYRALWKGEYVEARWLGEECLAIYEEVDDRWSILSIQLFLGQVDTALGAYQEAKEHYHICLDLLSETGNRYITCITLDCLGYLEYLLAEYSQAESHHLHSLELYCQINDRRGYGMALNNLGDVLRARHELAAARKRYQEALQVAQEITDLWGLTKSLKNLGGLCSDEKDFEKAIKYYQWALITGLESGRVSEYTEVLMGLAEARHEMGETVQAVELLALVANDPGAMQSTRQQATQKLSSLEQRLEPDEYSQAVMRGKSKTATDWVEG